jgi:hypothetical protein
MIVESTHYFALPGKVDEVLELRRRGRRLRLAMGLPPGRVFVNIGQDGRDVRWECGFLTERDLAADYAARESNCEFRELFRSMGAVVERFERHVFKLDRGEPRPVFKESL